MIPRVPSCPTSSAVAKRPCRRLFPCKFATGADVGHYFQQEIMIEGVLHVSAAQAGSCMERFGDFDGVPAPSLPSLDAVLASGAPGSTIVGSPSSTTSSAQASPAVHATASAQPSGATVMSMSRAGSASERVVNEAFCLATPPDNPGEGNRSPVRPINAGEGSAASRETQIVRGALSRIQASNSSSSRLVDSAAEQELLQLEAAAYQRAALSAQFVCTHEAMRASDARRRQRRAALLKLLRSGRVMTNNGLSVLQATPPAQLLASIGSSISSLGSWDDGETSPVSSCDAGSLETDANNSQAMIEIACGSHRAASHGAAEASPTAGGAASGVLRLHSKR